MSLAEHGRDSYDGQGEYYRLFQDNDAQVMEGIAKMARVYTTGCFKITSYDS